MVVRAVQKSVRIAPRKLRLVADVVRGKDLSVINDILSNLNKHGAGVVNEVIRQAVANAVNNLGLPEEGLKLKTLMINEGMGYRRYKAGARGMAKPRVKRTSHIIVEIESPAEAAAKPAAPKKTDTQSKEKAAPKQTEAETANVPAASSIAPAAKRTNAQVAPQKQTATKANKAGARVQSTRKAGEK
jgi:large subunit ribosomal protein L22